LPFDDLIAIGVQRTLLLQMRVRWGDVADIERTLIKEVESLRSLDRLAIEMVTARSKADFLQRRFDVPNK